MSVKERTPEEAAVESGFWTKDEYCRFRNIPESQERRERAAGVGPPFIIADGNGRILYPVAEAKAFIRDLPRFASRAEVYAAHPELAERDAKQSENMEQTRKQRWTAETRARHARKAHRHTAKATASA